MEGILGIWCIGILQLAVVTSAAQPSFVTDGVDWSAYLARSDLKWNCSGAALPTSWKEAAFTGNGMISPTAFHSSGDVVHHHLQAGAGRVSTPRIGSETHAPWFRHHANIFVQCFLLPALAVAGSATGTNTIFMADAVTETEVRIDIPTRDRLTNLPRVQTPNLNGGGGGGGGSGGGVLPPFSP
jgi:hypothetical protein